MLITFLFALVIIALIYWVITTLPLPPMVKTIATVVLVIGAIIWLAQLIGHPIPGI